MLQAATERMVRESLAPPSALFTFHFFRRHGEALGRALQAILGRPHQQLTTDPRLVRPHEVRQIDRDSMVRMLRAGHPMPIDATNRTAQLTPLQRLRPERVWQQIPLETYDTPENRFVLEISRRMLSAVQVLRQAAWYLRADIEASMRRRLDESAEHLAMLTMDDRFASLGRMTVVPSQSRVLQRRDGYRELTELWHLFQRSRQPLFERMQQAIDLRDIATLYELWLWFELIDRVQAITGVSPSLVPSLDAFGVPGWTSQARFGDHGSLFYNRTFKGYSGIWLRPDYVWERPDGTRVVMDAKFRMQRPTELIEESTGATTLLADQRAKDDDLQKMHVYCDAIEHVNAAIVLYPGHITTFRNRSGDRIQIGLADALAGGLQGIGALPMSPIAIGVDKE
jgi:predicted component of viral defense system (DUF524 family)